MRLTSKALCGFLVLILYYGNLSADDAELRVKTWVVSNGGFVKGNPITELDFALGSSRVTNADLKRLKGLKSLQYLRLDGTKVSDTGLKELKALTSLRKLNVTGLKLLTPALNT